MCRHNKHHMTVTLQTGMQTHLVVKQGARTFSLPRVDHLVEEELLLGTLLDPLLDGPRRAEAVHMACLCLANPVDPRHRLQVPLHAGTTQVSNNSKNHGC